MTRDEYIEECRGLIQFFDGDANNDPRVVMW